MNFYDWYWLAWLGPLFLVVEISGIGKKLTGKTLSEHVWHWFSIFEHRRFWVLRRIILFVFLTVLTCHFMFGLHGNPWLIGSAIPLGVVVLSSAFFEKEENGAYVDAQTRARLGR